LEGDWYTVSGITNLNLDLDYPGSENMIVMRYFDREYRIEMVRGPAKGKSSDVAIRIVEQNSKQNCFANPDADGWVGKNVAQFSDTPLEGAACGIKVFADWESLGPTDVQINRIQLYKGTVEQIVREKNDPLNAQRLPNQAAVSGISGEYFNTLTVNANVTSGFASYPFPMIKTEFGTFEAQMNGTNLNFNLDNEQERSFTASFTPANWIVDLSYGGTSREVTFKVLRADTGCSDQQTLNLDSTDNKTVELCGLGMRANWEKVAFKTDVQVEGLWIKKETATEILTKFLKGKDLIGSLLFSQKAKEMNQVVRTIDVFDLDNFQGAGDIRMYVGDQFGLAEGNLVDSYKDMYVAITSNGVIEYVLYTPLEWGQNHVGAKKVNNQQRGKQIGTDLPNGIKSMEEFRDFFNNMTDLQPQEISANEIKNIMTFGGATKADAQQALSELANQTPDIGTSIGEGATAVALIGTAAYSSSSSVVRNGLSGAIEKARNLKRPSIQGIVSRTKQTATTVGSKIKSAPRNTALALRTVARRGSLKRADAAVSEIGKIKGVLQEALRSSEGSKTLTEAITTVTTNEKAIQGLRDSILSVGRAEARLNSKRALSQAYNAAVQVETTASRYSFKEATKTILGKVSAETTAKAFGGVPKPFRISLPVAGNAVETVTQTTQTVRAGGRVWRAVSATARTAGSVARYGFTGASWTIRSGLSTARAVLLPTGPGGWAVFAVLTAVDIGFYNYDYTKLETSA
ncbi:MAG: hypothetical protein Q7R47_04750, partial [Candidatus Diapherotrites archaeon]|nr:hypothetical protein [Candidatus Diapherotrites archaeon]